jgi:hypothetical protein
MKFSGKFWAGHESRSCFRGLCVVAAVVASPIALCAQSGKLPVKPGLWEMQTNSGAGGGASAPAMPALPPEAEAKIAALPPAQQAQVRAAMSGAMGGGAAKPAGVTTQACILADTSMDSLLNQAQQRSSSGGMQCSFTNRVQNAQGASYDMSCTGPMGSAQGHTSYHAIDDEHFSSTTHMTINGKSQGQSMTMTRDATTTGKYVGSDCGDVKPVGSAPSH